jgi:hypothetical protein
VKIAYVLFHSISNDDGVVKKVISQKIAFESQRHEVKVFSFSKDGKPSKILNATVYKEKHATYRFRRNNKFIKDIVKFQPKIIYCRYDTFNVNLNKIINKGYPIVFEYNTYDLSEAWTLFKKTLSVKEYFKYITYYLSRKYWINKASGHVFVTDDLKKKYSRLIKNDTPSIAIPNSINLKRFSNSKQQHKNDQIRISFIGTPNQPWHGLEYIKELSKSLENVFFDIIGYDGYSTKNFKYHGYLCSEDYIPIISNSTACIGPLGIQSYKLKESSPLKVREYVALGVPVILGYVDFPLSKVSDDPMICKLSKNRLNWPNEIMRFIESLEKTKRVYKKSTLKLIDSKNVEINRVNFVTSL